jgi:hypothetical protein
MLGVDVLALSETLVGLLLRGGGLTHGFGDNVIVLPEGEFLDSFRDGHFVVGNADGRQFIKHIVVLALNAILTEEGGREDTSVGASTQKISSFLTVSDTLLHLFLSRGEWCVKHPASGVLRRFIIMRYGNRDTPR